MYDEPDPYTASDQIALDKLFVRRPLPGATITRFRVTTLAEVTPRDALAELARKGLIVFFDSPLLSDTFGTQGWECALTERGRAALSAPLRPCPPAPIQPTRTPAPAAPRRKRAPARAPTAAARSRRRS